MEGGLGTLTNAFSSLYSSANASKALQDGSCSSARHPGQSPGAGRQLLPTQHIFRPSHPCRLKADEQRGGEPRVPAVHW